MRPREREQDNLQISHQDLKMEKILVEVGHLRQQIEFCMNRIAGTREEGRGGVNNVPVQAAEEIPDPGTDLVRGMYKPLCVHFGLVKLK